MAVNQAPFNVGILKITPEQLKFLRPVTSSDYFESASGGFDDNGLFSIPIFGRMGSKEREQRFSYIDLKVDILHPLIYQTLNKLKRLYGQILSGAGYAVWDDQLKDFLPSNELDGQTGYTFFMQHLHEIVFPKNNSDKRNLMIDMIDRYRDRLTTDKLLVMPAGLRDIEIEADDKTSVSDHNDHYRKMISISKTISLVDDANEQDVLDRPKDLMTRTFYDLYKAIEDILTDKKGFVQNKWASRRIFDGTRNVITAMDHSVTNLKDPDGIKFTDTVTGIWQLSRAVMPKTVHYLRTGYLSHVFSVGDAQARLIHPSTLKSELVTVSGPVYDQWATVEGLEKVVIGFKDTTIRDQPIRVGDHYLALVYKGQLKGEPVFKVFFDIDDLPEGFDPNHVTPITPIELLYLSGYQHWNEFVGFITRYPITGMESIYPSTLYCKTTTIGEKRYELDDDWELTQQAALEYPIFGQPTTYQDSLSIPSVRLAGLGADFDGDTVSLSVVYSEEALEEVKRHLNSFDAYVDPVNGFKMSADVTTVGLVLKNMTAVPTSS